MLDSIETALLFILPWAFVAKTLALGVMGYLLNRRTQAKGPVGRKINIEFRDQAVMSAFITWGMFLLSWGIDATEVDWPFVSLALAGMALWPFKAAWSHWDVYRTYQAERRKKG